MKNADRVVEQRHGAEHQHGPATVRLSAQGPISRSARNLIAACAGEWAKERRGSFRGFFFKVRSLSSIASRIPGRMSLSAWMGGRTLSDVLLGPNHTVVDQIKLLLSLNKFLNMRCPPKGCGRVQCTQGAPSLSFPRLEGANPSCWPRTPRERVASSSGARQKRRDPVAGPLGAGTVRASETIGEASVSPLIERSLTLMSADRPCREHGASASRSRKKPARLHSLAKRMQPQSRCSDWGVARGRTTAGRRGLR